MPTKTIENLGCLKKASIPDGWTELPRPAEELSEFRQRKFFSSFDNDVELVFYFRGQAIDAESASRFREVLEAKPANASEEKLTPNEIISLQILMGFDHAGNNQYTNPDSPRFDLVMAATKRVNGRTILAVRGNFRGGKHYAGVFFAADKEHELIEEIMLQAPSAAKLAKYLDKLEFVLSKIEWK